MKQLFRVIQKAGSIIGIVLLCMLVFIVLSSKASGGEPTIFGYQVKTVLSGSMEPVFYTGSIIVTELPSKHQAYQKGDIITFQSDGRLITHRIIGVHEANGKKLYKTKGDHNNAPDNGYVQPDNIVGKYTGITIPKAGYIVSYATSKIGSALLLFIPGLLLVLSSAFSIFRAVKELEKNNVHSVG
ncbi:signal peptidase I SipW [Virgibacillus siamensis]|uniref:signal peptidase I SipW n=1 Tax=Virgibacillus siamensis TaxID=480071 RepID=UPI0009859E8D|nr:signal peptidase I [Virgibacillus siamensis]